MNAKTVSLALAGALGVSFLLSFVHVAPHAGKPKTDEHPSSLLAGAQIPTGVLRIINQKCADCHSTQTHWPVYAHFAPASWLLEHDVAEAREHWDAGKWTAYSVDDQMQLLSRLAARVRLASMPPVRYTLLHPGNKLSEEERTALYEWAKAERRRLRAASAHLENTNETKK